MTEFALYSETNAPEAARPELPTDACLTLADIVSKTSPVHSRLPKLF